MCVRAHACVCVGGGTGQKVGMGVVELSVTARVQ